MSVLIKGMEMPKLGDVFRVGRAVEGNLFICNLCAEETVWFPLAEVPTPHGRLTDADILIELAQNCIYKTVDCNDIARMPTVVGAEE